MKTETMNLDAVAKMLAIFATYWTNFVPVDGMAKSWAEAMASHETRLAWEALKQFRSEEDRKFAPTISEFIGRMDTLATIQNKKLSDNALLLEAPKIRSETEPIEVYTYKTTRTTPKKNKDDSDHEVRQASRVSQLRRQELDQQRTKDGFRKVAIQLGNVKTGYEWVVN